MGYEGITGAQDMAEAKPFTQLKVAIVGPPKSGKSRLAATAPQERFNEAGEILPEYKGTFVADFDGRAASLAGIKGVTVKTYQDTNPMSPEAWTNFNQDLGMLEYAHSQKKVVPATFIFDSVTYGGDAALRYAMQMSPTGTKDLQIGGFKLRIARGYEPYDAEVGMLSNAFQRIIAMGCNIIACFHDRAEEAADSTNENPKYTGRITVHPPRAKKYLAIFNELWLVKPEVVGGVAAYKVYVKPNYEFTGGTTLNLDAVEEADIQKMIEKHKSRTKV